MGLCLVPHSAQSADNVLGDPPVVGQLSTQLLDHAVDVVELGLVAGGRGRGHDSAHVGAVHAVHLLLLLLMVEGLLLELLLLLLMLLLEVLLLEIVLLELLLVESLLELLLLLLLLLLLMPCLSLSLCLRLDLNLNLDLILLLLLLGQRIQVERSRKAHVARGLILVQVSEDLRLWRFGCHCWGLSTG